jgi:hypothetical protein
MLSRGMATAVMFLALGQAATGGERPRIPHRISCTVVRYYVAKYSEPAAEVWARSKGATDTEIETARKCLPASTLQTASFAK